MRKDRPASHRTAPRRGARRTAPALCTLVALSQAVWLSGAVDALAGQTTYRYKEADGTVWFTDHRPRGANFKRFVFLGYHGRPPATASCRNVNSRVMRTRATVYREPIMRLSRRYGVSESLVRAIISVESCFDRLARSSAGAQGLMQLMPATARWLGVTDAYDPEQNLEGGIRYFRELQRRFDHNDRLALAAYNAGPHAVDRHNGIPPYPETRNYVKKVLERYRQFIDE